MKGGMKEKEYTGESASQLQQQQQLLPSFAPFLLFLLPGTSKLGGPGRTESPLQSPSSVCWRRAPPPRPRVQAPPPPVPVRSPIAAPARRLPPWPPPISEEPRTHKRPPSLRLPPPLRSSLANNTAPPPHRSASIAPCAARQKNVCALKAKRSGGQRSRGALYNVF